MASHVRELWGPELEPRKNLSECGHVEERYAVVEPGGAALSRGVHQLLHPLVGDAEKLSGVTHAEPEVLDEFSGGDAG